MSGMGGEAFPFRGERFPFRAELVDGPMAGEIVTAEQGAHELRIAVPRSRPSLAGYADPSSRVYLTFPVAATYVLYEGTYVEPRDPLLPKRIMVAGKYRWKP